MPVEAENASFAMKERRRVGRGGRMGITRECQDSCASSSCVAFPWGGQAKKDTAVGNLSEVKTGLLRFPSIARPWKLGGGETTGRE